LFLIPSLLPFLPCFIFLYGTQCYKHAACLWSVSPSSVEASWEQVRYSSQCEERQSAGTTQAYQACLGAWGRIGRSREGVGLPGKVGLLGRAGPEVSGKGGGAFPLRWGLSMVERGIRSLPGPGLWRTEAVVLWVAPPCRPVQWSAGQIRLARLQGQWDAILWGTCEAGGVLRRSWVSLPGLMLCWRGVFKNSLFF
jgi:hypothetical protein